jgi:hypothetical protein
MRCAFQMAIGIDEQECDQCKERLEGFFLGGTEKLACALPKDWFYVGREDEVPPCACYVAHYCDTYVWVMPEDMDKFTRFTITIMDIATGEIHAPKRTVLKKYDGAPKEENLVSTEVTVVETDTDALNKTDFGSDRQRFENPSINRGLFFVPR